MGFRKRQEGVALMIAVTVVAIVAIAASSLAHKVELGRSRTESLLRGTQAARVILGAEDFVKNVLIQDQKNNEHDYAAEPWAMPIVLPIDEGTLEGQITELHHCYNINNLLEPPLTNIPADADETPFISQFERLLAELDLNLNLIWAILDWIDPDNIPSGAGGVEDDGYLSKTPAYRTANQPMVSISELLLIEGIDDEVYKTLLPHVCALPETTAINVNTATIPVLASLHQDITAEKAKALHEFAREDKGFEKYDRFINHSSLDSITIANGLAGVKSEYFRVRAAATIGNTTVNLYSALHRAGTGQVRLLYRSRGTY